MARYIWKAFAIGIGAWLCWVSIAVGIAEGVRDEAPDIAVWWRPGNARANTDVAEQLLEAGPRAHLAEIAARARTALTRDLTYAPAVRMMALAEDASGGRAEARRLFYLSARLSRRDLLTRLWLIEDRVAANDISGALHQYDIALSTSDRAYEVLFPVLIQASANHQIIDPLARLLAQRHDWTVLFLPRLLAQAPSKEALLDLLERLSLYRAMPPRDLMQSLIEGLSQQHRVDLAWRAYRLVVRGRFGPHKVGILNGDFRSENAYPPIDWAISNDPAIGAISQRRASGGGGTGLAFDGGASGGLVARQVLQLPPGNYRLEAIAGSVAADGAAYWTLTCVDRDDEVLFRLDVPASPPTGRPHYGIFPVGNCGTQAINLYSQPRAGEDAIPVWVGAVSIRPT